MTGAPIEQVDVAVQLLPPVVDNPGLIARLAEARMAIGRFAGLAFAAYRADHADAFTLEGRDEPKRRKRSVGLGDITLLRRISGCGARGG